MIRFPVLLLLTLLFPYLPLQAQVVSLKVHDDSLSAGQTFELSLINPSINTYAEWIYPDSSDFPETLGFNNRQLFKTSAFSDSLVYHLQFFAVNDIVLPPLPVKAIAGTDTTIFYTKSVSLPFKTTLNDDAAELKPIKPIFFFSGPWWPYILAAIILTALGYWLWTRSQNKEEPQPIQKTRTSTVFINPLDQLDEKLRAIKETNDIRVSGDYKSYYSDISDALRQYFEELYDIPALESTSRELFRYLDAFGVDPELIKYTRQILSRADMVKFAKFTPSVDSALNIHLLATNFALHARSVDSARIARLRKAFEEAHQPEESHTSGVQKKSEVSS